MDAAAEADVLGSVLAADVETLRIGKHPRVAVRRAEEQRHLRAAGDGLTRDFHPVLEHPTLEQLERRVPADQLLDGGRGRNRTGDEPSPLFGVAQQREQAVAERVHRRLVPGVQQDDDRRDQLRVA